LTANLRSCRSGEVISSAAYRSAYVRISQLGWRREEPGEPECENPELVPSVVASLREHGLSEHTLAEQLGFDVTLLEDAVGVRLRQPPPMDAELARVIDLFKSRALGSR